MNLPEICTGGELSWSSSRADKFDTCRYRYALSYYAANEIPAIKRLKELSGMALWVGSLVHDTAQIFLENEDKLPTVEKAEELIRQVTHGQMPRDFEFSKINAKRFRLFEHEFNIPIPVEEKRARMGQVIKNLRSFFTSPYLAEAMEVGRQNWLAIDQVERYDVDGIPVFAAMDFAFRRNDGRVVIIDWKTGKPSSANKHQVAGYAMHALQAGWVKKPEDIDTVLAYLSVPEYKTVTMDQATIDKVKAKIKESHAQMAAFKLPGEGNRARLADFPKTTNTWACNRCEFQRICWPSGVPAYQRKNAVALPERQAA